MSKLLFCFILVSTLSACQKNSAPAPEKSKISVAYTTQPEGAVIQVAVAKGYFAEEGLEVTSSIHSFGKAALQTLLDGKADFATAAETPIMLSILKGAKIDVLSMLASSQTNNAILFRKDSGISQPGDLKGKRIGFTPGTTGEFFLDSFLAANVLSRKDIRAVPLKPDEVQDAIISKKIDAVSSWNFPIVQVKKLLGSNGAVIFDKDIYTETYNLVAYDDFVSKNPETVKRFLRGLIKAENYMKKNEMEAQAILAQAANVDKALVHEIWAYFSYHVVLDQSLLITLEDETRWAIKNKLTEATEMPNYMNHIHLDSLRAVKPEAIRLKR